MNRQISVRPSQELLAEIEKLGEEFQLSDADVVRQMMVLGLSVYKAGGYVFKPAKNTKYGRDLAKRISKRVGGHSRNVGAYEPTAAPLEKTPHLKDLQKKVKTQ